MSKIEYKGAKYTGLEYDERLGMDVTPMQKKYIDKLIPIYKELRQISRYFDEEVYWDDQDNKEWAADTRDRYIEKAASLVYKSLERVGFTDFIAKEEE